MFNERIRSQILGGVMQEMNGHLSGCYNEFYIILEDRRGQYAVTINADHYKDLGNAKLAEYLQTVKEEQKQLSRVEVEECCIKLLIALPYATENTPQVVNDILNPIFDYLKNEGYVSGCKECGQPVSLFDHRQVGGAYYYMCDECAKEYEKNHVSTQPQYSSQHSSQYNQQYQSQPVQSSFSGQSAIRHSSSWLIGVLGAIVGSLPGIALWIWIGSHGYIAGIVGILMGIGSLFGYRLFAGYMDNRGLLITVIWMILAIFLSNHLGAYYAIQRELSELGVSYGGIFTLFADIKEAGVMKYYLRDLGLGYLVTILSMVKIYTRVEWFREHRI